MDMLRFSKHGVWEMIIGTIVLWAIGAGLAWLWWPLSFIVLPVWIWLLAFFRDPDRPIPSEPGIMVSPADGTVSDVEQIEFDEHLQGPALRIGIFLSVFNVHVNRSPCDARVIKTIYKKGKFINAMHHATASADNESNTIVLADRPGEQPIATVRQIVGLIARRIICDAKIGDTLTRGQRIGLIKFGSRTELCVPMWMNPQATVRVGQKVSGARDVICRVGERVQGSGVRIQESGVSG